MPILLIIGTLLVLSPACAQQLPVRSDSIVVTGTWEPLNLDELDRSVTVLPLRADDHAPEQLDGRVCGWIHRSIWASVRPTACNPTSRSAERVSARRWCC